jgi:predicted Ser/Thr protein kinase/tetratricopeptide (TPR) repeat protein
LAGDVSISSAMPLAQPTTKPLPAALPLPRALAADARYRVLGEIGRGGMGVVYEAVQCETGERVAIKTLTSPREGLLRFKNEYRLASRLAHPNLLALYDLVIADDGAYFVMEYAPGVDLRRWVRDGARCDVRRLYAAGAQILDALDCLASEGIVHRDLKPSNIVVSDDGHVKILDFGLAGSAETPDFRAAMLAGTPTYMSPEQIDGRPLDVRSDLYALGAIVYELVVGEPPFAGPQRRVLDAQRFAHALPPSDRAHGVPPDLELWILRLLAKRPGERFDSARAARKALEACGAPTTPARHRAREWGSYEGPAFDGELVGRAAERALLCARLTRVAAGGSELVLIAGESGIGKSALGAALLDDARAAGCVVLRGACREHEAVTYNAFDQVVDGAAALLERALDQRQLDPATLDELFGHDLPLLARLFPVLRELPPPDGTEAASALPPSSAAPASPLTMAPTPIDRERAFAVLQRLLQQLTARRPLVLLLDDLHWADEDSLALLGHLVSGTPRLLVLGTARPFDGDGDGDALEHFLERMERSAGATLTRLALGPLGAGEDAHVVAATLPPARELAPHAVESICREAAGNPFLLVELARLHGEHPELPLPTLSTVVRRRLALLSAEELALAELAAIAPGPVDAELLRAALLDDEGAPSPACDSGGAGLRRLCRLKILRESPRRGPLVPEPPGVRPPSQPTAELRYDFYHHRIREALRADIPEPRARQLHRRLAVTMAQLHPTDAEPLVRELLLAGDEPRAAAHAARAGDAALGRLAHARAVELYQLALRHEPDAQRAAQLRLRIGYALEGSGRFADASAHFAAGLAILGDAALPPLARTHARIHFAHCLMHRGDLDASATMVEETLAELGHPRRQPAARRALAVLWLLVRVLLAGSWRRAPRLADDAETEVRQFAYAMALPHFQLMSRNLEQLEFALRYRLLGARSSSPEVRHEVHAVALMLLLPFAHLGRGVARRIDVQLGRLEAGGRRVAGERARLWLPFLHALHELVSGRPDRALPWFDACSELHLARSGYVALQRQNALFLAGDYERYAVDVARAAAHRDGTPTALDRARLAYIARLRGDEVTARHLLADVAQIDPTSLPWTHRSLFTYQLVELALGAGDSEAAARLACAMLPRVRRTALSPTTGVFECADAVVRAFLAEAKRLTGLGHSRLARALVDDAARTVAAVPALRPPLFAARVTHDRALVALARGRRARAMQLLWRAEARSRTVAVPCFRLRLLDDLLALLAAADPRRAPLAAEAEALAFRHRLPATRARAAWLAPLDT